MHSHLAQICGPLPSVEGAASLVTLPGSSNNGSYTVNTTVAFSCPGSSIVQTSVCTYAPVGGAQWAGDLQDCPSVVGMDV